MAKYTSWNILVIDDEEVILDSCREILSKENYEVKLASSGKKGLELIRKNVFDVIIVDLKLPDINGIEILKRIKKDNPDIIVIVITGYATIASAVEVMKLGAYDFIPKSFTPDELRIIVKRGLEKRRLTVENILLKERLMIKDEDEIIIGKNKVMHQIYKLLKKVGPTDSTVLIYGESGTGKELVAKAIHRHSLRNSAPFVTVDCGSLAETLIESELFGHVKGSFTGAITTKYGRFELASSGTIFFDEIGNISLKIQGKLLRAIQEREITRVGDTKPIKIDVRIIAATNKNLEEIVKKGEFREDLFYRLNVVPINLPPLRERRDDIPHLVNYFLKKYSIKRRKEVISISNPAMEILVKYDWPGNVRELENVIERAVVLSEGKVIEPIDLLHYKLIEKTSEKPIKYLEEVEKEHISKIFKIFEGNKTRTAKYLGIDRKTLKMKLKKYHIQ